jgi:hypothetical protein
MHTEPMLLTLEWASVDDYIRFMQAILTGLNAMLAKFPAKLQAEVWRAIVQAAGQSTTPDGRCHTENEVLLTGRGTTIADLIRRRLVVFDS